jgi:hypothetical protein
MANTYHSDEEIVALVETIGDSCNSYFWVANLVRERFEQKDKQREHISARLNEAANIIGHNTISECMMYE